MLKAIRLYDDYRLVVRAEGHAQFILTFDEAAELRTSLDELLPAKPSAEPMAYVGRAACGCTVGATVDLPDRRAEVAHDVAEFIRDGFTVHRVTIQEARLNWECTHAAAAAPKTE